MVVGGGLQSLPPQREAVAPEEPERGLTVPVGSAGEPSTAGLQERPAKPLPVGQTARPLLHQLLALASAREMPPMRVPRAWAGVALTQREPLVPYTGADGVPIREENLAEHGSTVITRNSYGARCLNTPDVLFADIDHAPRTPAWLEVVGCLSIPLTVALAWRLLGSLSAALQHGLPALLAVVAARRCCGAHGPRAARGLPRRAPRLARARLPHARRPAAHRHPPRLLAARARGRRVLLGGRGRPALPLDVQAAALLPRAADRQALAHRHRRAPQAPPRGVAGRGCQSPSGGSPPTRPPPGATPGARTSRRWAARRARHTRSRSARCTTS